MQFSSEIIIDKPVEEVTALFANPQNLMKWQPALLSFEHISGTKRMPGAKSRMKVHTPKGDMILTETVSVNKLPDEFIAIYEGEGIWTELRNYFSAEGANKTLYRCETDVELSGAMKLLGMFMAGMFKKEAEKQLASFKSFAENA